MKHIKMNLKNCLNIGSEDSAMDYAFMFSAIESCDINRLSPETYLRKLILVSMRKKWRKSSFCPAILGSKLSCKREQNRANLIEFCRVQPIIIKDKC